MVYNNVGFEAIGVTSATNCVNRSECLPANPFSSTNTRAFAIRVLYSTGLSTSGGTVRDRHEICSFAAPVALTCEFNLKCTLRQTDDNLVLFEFSVALRMLTVCIWWGLTFELTGTLRWAEFGLGFSFVLFDGRRDVRRYRTNV